MKNIDKSIAAFSIAIFFLMTLARFANAQTQEDVGAQVQAMWSANNITQLNTYLQGLLTSSPDYAPAVVAGAFYDFIFLGKLNDAKAKLLRVSGAAQSNPQTYPETFTTSLSATITEVNDEIRIQTAHGKSEQDWQTNANPQAVKNAVGTNTFPIIELIMATPKVSLPSQ
ncbi:MAG: hypothetical protein WC003_16380 [Terrimicrobiaceae bacterium]